MIESRCSQFSPYEVYDVSASVTVVAIKSPACKLSRVEINLLYSSKSIHVSDDSSIERADGTVYRCIGSCERKCC